MRFSRLIIIFALLQLAPTLAQAETLAEAMEKCRVVSNSLNRLVCYDQLAQRANNLEDSDLQEFYAQRPVGAPPTARAPQQPRGAQPPKPESTFGLEAQIQREKSDTLPEITAVVGKVEKAPKGKLIITLDDGQVWRQTDTETLRLKSGDTVVISRGMIGAFYLKKTSGKKRIRVKRAS